MKKILIALILVGCVVCGHTVVNSTHAESLKQTVIKPPSSELPGEIRAF